MLVLLPFILLQAAGLALLLMQRARPNPRRAWLLALGAALLVWMGILAAHWQTLPALDIRDWTVRGGLESRLVFSLDLFTFPYAFSLASLGLAAAMTSSARLDGLSTPGEWAASLSVTGAGILAVTSSSPLAFILTWTLVDVNELVLSLLNGKDERSFRQAALAFMARVGSSMLLLAAMLYSRERGQALELANVTPHAGLYLLLAAGLRLGGIPLHMPYTREPGLRRGLGTVLRLAGAASGVALLARTPLASLPLDAVPLLQTLVTLTVLYGAVMWFAAEDELNGRPYWLIALGGLAAACVLRGQPAASISWGVGMVLGGGTIFLFFPRPRRLLALPALAALALSGLPYTPGASGLEALVHPFHFDSLVFILSAAMLLGGIFRHALRLEENPATVDGIARAVYPGGLGLLVSALWFIGVLGYPGSFRAGAWWAGVAAFLPAAGLAAWRLTQPEKALTVRLQLDWLFVLLRRLGNPVEQFLRFEWLYRLLGGLYFVSASLVNALTALLEGPGGVLWGMLFLAMLFSLLMAGGGGR